MIRTPARGPKALPFPVAFVFVVFALRKMNAASGGQAGGPWTSMPSVCRFEKKRVGTRDRTAPALVNSRVHNLFLGRRGGVELGHDASQARNQNPIRDA